MPDYFGYEEAMIIPSGIRVWVDDQDITQWVFGVPVLNPTEIIQKWHDIDISQYVRGPGRHILKVTADVPGKIDARIEVR